MHSFYNDFKLLNRTRLGHLIILLIFASVSAVVAYNYYYLIERNTVALRLELHQGIIESTAISPYRYRILVPFLVQFVINILSALISKEASFIVSFICYDWIAIFFIIILLYRYLRIWFTTEQSLIGVLFVTTTIPIALRDHYYQPWSLLEAAFMIYGLIAIYNRKYWTFGVLVCLASLNRETAIFLPLLFFLTGIDSVNLGKNLFKDRKHILLSGVYFLLSVFILLGLRVFLGGAAHAEDIRTLFLRNISISSLVYTLRNGGLFLGAFWLFALLGLPKAPEFVKRSTRIIPIYLIFIAIWGVWFEVRLLMPLYPILIPLGLTFMFPAAVMGEKYKGQKTADLRSSLENG
ncbi:MAG: hypothetical protein FOGNACKC_00039 [Anaerolineae bacterium]|nr:hypothetical protein [Anaerolineae bacterium]